MAWSRRNFLIGAGLGATVVPNALGAPSRAAEANGLFLAVRNVEPTAAATGARFLVDGKWSTPVTLQLSAHNRDDRPLDRFSELVAIPPNASQVQLLSEQRVTAVPQFFGQRYAAPFRTSVETSYAWGFPVVTRKGWGADESLRNWPEKFHPFQAITVHHTSGRWGQGVVDYREAVRAIYRFHATADPHGRGWGDIGYHLVIDANGVIYQGRRTGLGTAPIFRPGAILAPGAEVVTAAHAHGANAGNIGICVIGDFMSGHPSSPALLSLVTVLRTLCHGLRLDPYAQIRYVNPETGWTTPMPVISGHRDWHSARRTTCPGDQLWGLLGGLRALPLIPDF